MKHPKLEFDKLFAFTQAVAAGTLTKAAEKLNLNQSSISRKIIALQEDLGCSLLSHSPRQGIVLTPEGQIVYETAMSLLQQSVDLESSLKNLGAQRRYSLSALVTVDFFDALALDKLKSVTEWEGAHQIRISADKETFEDDAYIHLTNLLPHKSNSSYQEFLKRSYGLYGSSEYLESKGIPRFKSDLPCHKLLALESQLKGIARAANAIFNLGARDGETEPYIILSSAEMLLYETEKGSGLAWLPVAYAEQRSPALRQVILKDMANPIEETLYWGKKGRS